MDYTSEARGLHPDVKTTLTKCKRWLATRPFRARINDMRYMNGRD